MSGLFSISVELECWGSLPSHAGKTEAQWVQLRHLDLIITADEPGKGHTEMEILASARYCAGVIARAAIWLGDAVAYDDRRGAFHRPAYQCWPNLKQSYWEVEDVCGSVIAEDITIVYDENADDRPEPHVAIKVPRENGERWLAEARELIAAILISDQKQAAPSSRDAHADAKAPTIRNIEQTRASR